MTELKITCHDVYDVSAQIWIEKIAVGDHVTIRRRCKFREYGIYEVTTAGAWSNIPPTQDSSYNIIFNAQPLSASTQLLVNGEEYVISYTMKGPTGSGGGGGGGGGNSGAAKNETFYVTFQTSQDFKVTQKPLYDDGVVRFGWDSPGNDIEFFLIPGSEPSGINPATGESWGNIPSSGGFPASQLQANIWNNDSFLPSTSTFISPGVTYDLMPTGVFALERGWGTISPYYSSADPDTVPNFPSYSSGNSYIGKQPPFPIYNFIYHNLGASSNTTLQIERINN